MLPTSPLTDGASPGAMLFELDELEELEAVEVPLVVLWSLWTSADKLASDENAAVTELPFLQSDVCVPDPETKFTVAHYNGFLSACVRKRRKTEGLCDMYRVPGTKARPAH